MAKPKRTKGEKPQGKPAPDEPKAPRPAAKPASSLTIDGSRTWVAVAEIARPHGVRGELRLRVYSGDPALLVRRPPIKLRGEDGKITSGTILSTRHADKALLVMLEGVADRNAAEAMRGKEVLVERDAFAPLEEDEFYAVDIEGARAELVTGEAIGTVTGLGSYPTCDVLLIEHEGKRLEVPLLPHFVESVDVGAKLVRILTLEGIT